MISPPRARTVLATSVSNSPRALTAPIDCNNSALTRRASRLSLFVQSTSASAIRDRAVASCQLETPDLAQTRQNATRRRVDTSANAARAASERTAREKALPVAYGGDAVASFATKRTANYFFRRWRASARLEFMNKKNRD